ncbi:glucose dehydrogenase [FAD, quinone]-like [Spodoptera litura]|uniref:Glucose dehydrogenase [FAD, quinone]-like n=1 Tax=Spodoptera litura TaxID=69820 RepID=A0A9J7IVN3_SPOLT|nr:glucose dehydrogenase [FAD, quinone]-like [Spodoptera litura]
MAALNSAVALLLVTLGFSAIEADIVFPSQAKLTDNASYDYIIVGGGTCGCVIARRLVDSNYTVLVLESGDDPSANSMLPGLFYLLPGTSIDYDYRSTFDDYAAGAQGNFTRLTAGNALGGSSVLNHHLSIRPIPQDYDDIASLTGDDGWSYDNMLPYFKKTETVKDEEIASTYSEYHGDSGPVGITRELHDDDVAYYLKALAEVGNPTVEDLNGPVSVGYMQPLLNIASGIRQTPAYVYLNDIKDNPNLHVSKNTKVSKINFENSTAVSVEAIYKDTTYTFRANKEIIVSAGVFNTPQILQLSGVGSTDVLDSLNVDQVADLPVGDNLRIPPTVIVVQKTKKHILPSIPNLVHAFVPFSIPFPLLLGTTPINKSSEIPDYQTYNLMLPHDTPYLTLACTFVYGYSLDVCLRWQTQIASRDAVYSVVVNLDAVSTGTVRANSTDINDAPLITTGFYSESEDLERAVDILLDLLAVEDSATLKDLGAAVVGVDFSECADKEAGSREFWKCYVLHRTIAGFLYSGTCPMQTCVDSELKLLGLNKIRVADASVFPKVLHGALNAAVLSLGEKAADLILQDAAN